MTSIAIPSSQDTIWKLNHPSTPLPEVFPVYMPEQKETFSNPQVRQLFDYESWTYSYLVFDPQSLDAVSIDPVLEQHPRDLKLIHELGT